MSKMFSNGSIVEYLVILGLVFISKITLAQDLENSQELKERREYKVKVISSELWHHGVSQKGSTSETDSVIKVPEDLELSLRRLEN
jgi:hypothetical protein